MGLPVLLLGKSGGGKSASLRNFPDAGVINVMGKPFPFKGRTNFVTTKDYEVVRATLLKAASTSIVIDDAGYLITDNFMQKHANAGAGNAVFSLYNEIGDRFYNLVEFVTHELPKEKIVYFFMHEEKSDAGDIKPKTIGKLLDEKVCLEGMFTIVLRATVSGNKHVFFTQSSGFDIQKTPMGLFDEMEIDNDLKIVDDKLREYYEITQKQKTGKGEFK